jgi:hypothetical protein
LRSTSVIQSAKLSSARRPAVAGGGNGMPVSWAERQVVGRVGIGVQDVHLDVLGKDPEGDLDRSGRAGGVEQGAEDLLAHGAILRVGQR